jgi:hypothetical protein
MLLEFGAEVMFTSDISVPALERMNELRKRSARNGQPLSIAMFGWEPASPTHQLVTKAFARALAHDSKLPPTIRDIYGMSGQLYRSFINNLVEGHDHARYLEIGSWAGSTATAALYGNTAKCICVDDWSQFGSTKEVFFANIELVLSDAVDFKFIEQDFRTVDYTTLGKFNIYMFDGPHAEIDQYDGIVTVQSALEKSYILIVDDWNWLSAREGTLRALVDTNSRIESWIEVRTTFDNTHPCITAEATDWHNGYLIALIEKDTQKAPR